MNRSRAGARISSAIHTLFQAISITDGIEGCAPRWVYDVKPELIRQLFSNASQALIAANTPDSEFHLEVEGQGSGDGKASAVRPKLEHSVGHGALGEGQEQEGHPDRFLVRVTSVRRRLIDEDNLCEKYVLDCCRYAGLIPDDRPRTTQITVTQRKAGKEEAEHTVIEIFAVTDSTEFSARGKS